MNYHLKLFSTIIFETWPVIEKMFYQSNFLKKIYFQFFNWKNFNKFFKKKCISTVKKHRKNANFYI